VNWTRCRGGRNKKKRKREIKIKISQSFARKVLLRHYLDDGRNLRHRKGTRLREYPTFCQNDAKCPATPGTFWTAKAARKSPRLRSLILFILTTSPCDIFTSRFLAFFCHEYCILSSGRKDFGICRYRYAVINVQIYKLKYINLFFIYLFIYIFIFFFFSIIDKILCSDYQL